MNTAPRPEAWLRLGTALGAIAYAAVTLLGWWSGLQPPDVLAVQMAAALACAAGFALSRARPGGGGAVAVSAVWLEVLYCVHRDGIHSGGSLVLPLLASTGGLLLGGRWPLGLAGLTTGAAALSLALRGELGVQGEAAAVTLHLFVVAAATGIAGALTWAALRAYGAALRDLDRERRRYREVFDGAPDGLVAVDGEGRVEEVNPAAARLLDRGPVVGRPLEEVLLRAGGAQAQAARIAAPGPLSGPATLALSLPGAARVLEVSASQRRRPDGPGRLLVIRDATERRALEQRARSAERLEAVEQLAGGLANEFNNLLTAVGAGTAELAAHPDPQARALGAEIGEAQRRAAELTRKLLAFARREVRRAEPVELAAAAAELAGPLRKLLGDRHWLRLEAPAPVIASADRAHLERVLVALVSNARDALPAGGEVRVGVRALGRAEAAALGSPLSAGAQALLEVSDDGAGMPPEVAARAFEPFNTTKPDGDGAGLGLATVRGLVAQGGGHVALETSPGWGTTVRVFLAALAPEVRSAAPARSAAADGPRRILIAEDDPLVRAVARRVLERAGFPVVAVDSGEAALSALDADPGFSLLLTDVVMPGLDGFQLAERARAAVPGLEVLFMSGYHEARPGQAAPGEVVQKPFTPEELVGSVREKLARAGGEPARTV